MCAIDNLKIVIHGADTCNNIVRKVEFRWSTPCILFCCLFCLSTYTRGHPLGGSKFRLKPEAFGQRKGILLLQGAVRELHPSGLLGGYVMCVQKTYFRVLDDVVEHTRTVHPLAIPPSGSYATKSLRVVSPMRWNLVPLYRIR